MHRRILSFALIGFVSIIIINWSCTKLDTTNLGSDLIPIVDNVNTFADTFPVNVAQSDYTDTTQVGLNDNHIVGNITNDPMFGKTSASIYFQLKPGAFPFAFAPKDSLVGAGAGFDSVVLCLSYKGFYGDTTQVQQLQVYEINDNQFRDNKDTVYDIRYQPTTGAMIGTKLVDVTTLDEPTRYAYIKDSVTYQVRIKLDQSFANRIFTRDSTATGPNNAFYNDSLFLREFNGFAVKPTNGMGNGLMYVNLADTNTKLEVHFRARAGGHVDTTYRSFKLRTSTVASATGTTKRSANANYISRDRTGSPSLTPSADELYLQTQPGTYATLTIPQLTGYSNRIIHRAEIIIEQIPDNPFYDSIFEAPSYLYLDLKDTGTATRYKPIYLDINPSVYYNPDNPLIYYPGSPDFGYFGGYARRKTGPFGGSIVYYNINISRYVQQMVKNQSTNYQMRLFPAYKIHYSQYSNYISYNNSVAFGRVKVGTGTNPNYKMRLRIIYSPIK